MKAEKKNEDPGFEKALERLEKIVTEMEEGDLSLDKMMQHFEEGSRLVQYCSARLNEVEKKIEQLVKKDGGTGTAPFEAEAE
ncbi:MAG TPA: exodeoxyribonuclease VII small subunit [Kiritimatiellia bacterium]|nr:exodeoxyribonuclease VII small subunit [Kiritimatiellia bacterium]HNS80328.1 exodeoxyribonuclease VII small subunit [Kiritimatiellia bacterium]HPA78231.1 exodeoxyribonuclease VII small subunit [Kiritimatiellia bacterium]HQQ03788.1 exodeoxyribonuclease VII small subunit [Kiritimatiellia bacterium]